MLGVSLWFLRLPLCVCVCVCVCFERQSKKSKMGLRVVSKRYSGVFVLAIYGWDFSNVRRAGGYVLTTIIWALQLLIRTVSISCPAPPPLPRVSDVRQTGAVRDMVSRRAHQDAGAQLLPDRRPPRKR